MDDDVVGKLDVDEATAVAVVVVGPWPPPPRPPSTDPPHAAKTRTVKSIVRMGRTYCCEARCTIGSAQRCDIDRRTVGIVLSQITSLFLLAPQAWLVSTLQVATPSGPVEVSQAAPLPVATAPAQSAAMSMPLQTIASTGVAQALPSLAAGPDGIVFFATNTNSAPIALLGASDTGAGLPILPGMPVSVRIANANLLVIKGNANDTLYGSAL
jgi:hypothetical protein